MPLIQPEQLDLTRGHRMAMAGRGQKQSQQIQMATYEMQRQTHLRNTLEKDFDNYIKFGTYENRVQFAQHIGSKGATELAGFLRNMSQDDWDKWHKDAQPEVEEELITLTVGDKEYTDIVKGSPQHLKLKAMEGAFRGKVKTKTKPKFETIIAEENDPYGFSPGDSYQINPKTGKATPLVKGKPDVLTTITNVTRGDKDKYGFRPGTIYQETEKDGETTISIKQRPEVERGLTRIDIEAKALGIDPDNMTQEDAKKLSAALKKEKVELTDVKLDKLVKDLKTLRLRIETTKGIDPALFMLFGESSAALDAYKKGDTTQALSEIDAQIEKYEGIRSGRTGKVSKLPKGLAEEDIEFNTKQYNKTRQEVIDQFIKMNK